VNTKDFQISCVPVGTAAAPFKCTEKNLMKELKKELEVSSKQIVIQLSSNKATGETISP
jgi:hypothetical protein